MICEPGFLGEAYDMSPRLPFLPLFVEGQVVKGFGRGSKQLGIPTANFTDDVVRSLPAEVDSGVYFGFANIDAGPVSKMVMSVGWNPHFQNKVKTMETHIMKKFDDDFYGSILRVGVLGFIRPMTSFTSMDELISAIDNDISRADSELDQPPHQKYRDDPFFAQPLLPLGNGSPKHPAAKDDNAARSRS